MQSECKSHIVAKLKQSKLMAIFDSRITLALVSQSPNLDHLLLQEVKRDGR